MARDGGDARLIGEDALVADLGGSHAIAQRTTRFVVVRSTATDHAKHFHMRAERRNIYRDIARSAQAFTLLHKIHDGHRGFRRKPGSRAPQIAIQHQIAEHADALTLDARNQPLETCNSGRSKTRHGTQPREIIQARFAPPRQA